MSGAIEDISPGTRLRITTFNRCTKCGRDGTHASKVVVAQNTPQRHGSGWGCSVEDGRFGKFEAFDEFEVIK